MTEHQDDAAGRVAAYLDACGGTVDPTPNLPCHRAVHFAADADETTIYELTRADLHEVLQELADAKAEVGRLTRERDSFAGKAQIYQQQRDGVSGSIGAIGEALGRLAEFCLAENPGSDGWKIVGAHAAGLRRIAGPPQRGQETAREGAGT